MITALILSALLQAQPSSPCDTLLTEYRDTDKLLAMSYANDTDPQTAMDQARLTLDLIRANDCPVPTRAPTAQPYVRQAMQCRLDQMRIQLALLRGQRPNTDPASCDMTQWRTPDAS